MTTTLCSGERTGQAADPTGVTLTLEPSGFAHLTFDLPGEKVNKLTTLVMERLETHIATLGELGRQGRVHGLMICSLKPGVFIAGADIAEIERITDPAEGAAKSRAGQKVFAALEALPFPIVCAVSGACVGGGYEMAMACTRIVASDDARVQIGLPEVRLGILPGFGGTQRLRRRVGLRAALDLILAGKTLDARRARNAGFVDLVVPTPLLEREACRELIRLATEGGRRGAFRGGFTGFLLEGNPLGRALVAFGARRALAARAPEGHYPAPWRALEAVLVGYRLSPEEANAVEARLLGEMIVTRTSKNLVFLFNAHNAARKDPLGGDKGEQPGSGTPARPNGGPRAVSKIGVIGAGVMGAGIARVAADAEVPVRLKDVGLETLAKGLGGIAKDLDRRVRRGRMDRREFQRRLARISTTTDWSGFSTCDLVIEAVLERMDVKRAVLAEAESVLAPDAVYATNTSSLRVSELARSARVPERVCGLHFFNPVAQMPLVEVVAAEQTSRETLALAAGFVIRIGKVPVVVRDGPGFLVNRLLLPYLGQAVALAEAGADIEAIDRQAASWGLPMGPFRLLDEIGLDIALHAATELAAAFPSRTPQSNGSLRRLVDAGLLGVKSGRGFYPHPRRAAGGGSADDNGNKSRRRSRSKKPLPADVEAVRLVRAGASGGAVASARTATASRAAPAGDALIDLLVLPIVNEAAQCLEEGIVASARECDLAMVMGTGFPPFHGGPLRYADALGVGEVVRRLEALADRAGAHLRPVPALVERVRRVRPFHAD